MAAVLKQQASSVGAGAAVDVPELVEQPKLALLPVLKRLDGWQEAVEDSITVEQLSGAMTNMVYRCGLLDAAGVEQQVILMRVHASSSDLFDRQEEIETFRGVSSAGMGPKLLMLFDNGRVEEFLTQHVTLAASDLQDSMVGSAIAATLAHFHAKLSEALSGSDHDDVLIWSRLRSWLQLAQGQCTSEEMEALGMSDLGPEIDRFESIMMSSYPCWIALCHNDLQYGNIMALTGTNSSSTGGDAAADSAADLAAAAPANLGRDRGPDLDRHLERSGTPTAAAAAVVNQLGGLHITEDNGSSSSAVSSSQPIPMTAHALQQHQGREQAAAAAAAAAAESHSAEDSHMAVAGTSPTYSVTSVGSFRHRSAGPAVQLPDGSIVLPGMKARPRGQSPERGKRPDHHNSSNGRSPSPNRLGSMAPIAAAGSSSLSISSSSGLDLAAVKPPSAAAVLRHAGSKGDLDLVTAGRSAAAAAGSSGRRQQRISSSGLDASESAEDSDDGDLLLPNQGLKLEESGSGFNSDRGLRDVAVDLPVAAATASAKKYRQIRNKRKTPPAGFEFPTFQGSDVEGGDGSSSSDLGSSGSSSDLDSDEGCSIGGSSSSRPAGRSSSSRPNQANQGIRSAEPTPAAAAAAAEGGRSDLSVTPPNNTWNDKSLTLIDYEYAGFNPIAFDIANHWCEWAADYHTDEPHVLDFGRLPSEHQQLIFVEEYLRALLTGLGVSVPDAQTHCCQQQQQQQRPDDLWSTVSSIGGSVISVPESEARLYLDQSDNISVKSYSSLQSEHQHHQQQPLPKLAAAASAGESAAAAASPAELRDLWRWIDLYQPDRSLLTQHKTLDLTCYTRICKALTEASRAYMAASHLQWALWGVIQSKVSDVEFDFEGYGLQRWNMYLATRPAALQQHQQ